MTAGRPYQARYWTPDGDVDDVIESPAYLYQCFCAHLGALYVGITEDLAERLRVHQRTKPWWTHVDFIGVDVFRTRDAAKRAESFCIKETGPTHNAAEAKTLDYLGWATCADGFTLRRHASGGWADRTLGLLNPDRSGPLFLDVVGAAL